MHGLTEAKTVADIAALLEVTPSRLKFLAYGANNGATLYFKFKVPKKGGGERLLSAPIPELKKVQRKLASLLLEKYFPKPCVHGFVQGRSFVTGAHDHTNKRWVASIDLKDFFPSINYGRVRGVLLSSPFSLSQPVANIVAALCTHEDALPQGAPTSPVLSNLICRKLDKQLYDLSRSSGCRYTRYADDLVFSTNKHVFPAQIIRMDGEAAEKLVATPGPQISDVIASNGFVINLAKVKLRSDSSRQMVTGCVVNERINAPRKYVRDLRWLIYVWQKFGIEAARDLASKLGLLRDPSVALGAAVRGRLAHLQALKGGGDSVYQKLSASYSSVADGFIQPDVPLLAEGDVIRLLVEGTTDEAHFKTAVTKLQASGVLPKFTLLTTSVGGSVELIKTFNSLRKAPPGDLTICVFDSDEKEKLAKVFSPGMTTHIFGPTLAAIMVTPPGFRPTEEVACVELLYRDEDLLKKDSEGRRIYLASEFVPPHLAHHSEPVFRQGASGMGLVVDSHVYDKNSNEQVALSKAQFAEHVGKSDIPFGARSRTGGAP